MRVQAHSRTRSRCTDAAAKPVRSSASGTVRGVQLALQHPAAQGEYRVFNHFTEMVSGRELADRVSGVAQGLGLAGEIAHTDNLVKPFAAALAIALLGGPQGAFAAGRHHDTAPKRTIGATIVSGTPQIARAYAAPGAPNYISEFPKPLVARLVGTHLNSHRMRFTCAKQHCALNVPTEPDGGKRVNPATYEINAVHGQAALQITLSTDQPGTFIVYAEPVGDGSQRITRSAPFVLVAR